MFFPNSARPPQRARVIPLFHVGMNERRIEQERGDPLLSSFSKTTKWQRSLTSTITSTSSIPALPVHTCGRGNPLSPSMGDANRFRLSLPLHCTLMKFVILLALGENLLSSQKAC